MEEKGLSKGESDPWTVLEFYSGIGGMRYSLREAGIPATVVEAFDINDTANDVYEFNFGHRPHQGNIQSLTASDLDKYGADAWLLSPPCQPYTRQGLQKHSEDARALSFIKMIELIPHMVHPPLFLFVENVVGFETSDTHQQLTEILVRTGFVTQEYILSPLQFCIPYSRPRYFCLAKRKPSSFQNPCYNYKLLWTSTPFLSCDKSLEAAEGNQNNETLEELKPSCLPIKHFLETQTFSDDGSIHSASASMGDVAVDVEDGDGENVSGCCFVDLYCVPSSLIDRWGTAMDIVYPDSRRCCCFTKSYYRYVKGTGSFLATKKNDQSLSVKVDSSVIKNLGLRYFTPREVANLHSFPENFQFPKHITLRQRYALLGNSLSVAVVAPLLQHLFSLPS